MAQKVQIRIWDEKLDSKKIIFPSITKKEVLYFGLDIFMEAVAEVYVVWKRGVSETWRY